MPKKSFPASLATLLVAVSWLATGCSDSIVGPSLDSPNPVSGRSPRVASLDPDVSAPRPAKQWGRDLAILRVEDDGAGGITVVVRNSGPSYFYGRVEVGLYREYGQHAALVQIEGWGGPETLLAPGATVTLSIQRNDCGGSIRYFVLVDPHGYVLESNEDNNRSNTFFSFGCS